jgi:hypothetical protein
MGHFKLSGFYAERGKRLLTDVEWPDFHFGKIVLDAVGKIDCRG